jgi:hypothetical protein
MYIKNKLTFPRKEKQVYSRKRENLYVLKIYPDFPFSLKRPLQKQTCQRFYHNTLLLSS